MISLLISAGLLIGPAIPFEGIPDAPLPVEESDPFLSLDLLSVEAMRAASGRGAAYGVDLSGLETLKVGALQNNDADTNGVVENTVITDSTTGEIAGNAITGNSGITTVFINSGNNVILQNTVQVNVYTPLAQ